MGWLCCILSPPIHSITLSAAHSIQHADFSQWFSHSASMCIITHAISPLALRTGSNVAGWLSPPRRSTQGMQDHLAFLCYHPLAFPAPCNLCRVLQTLPSLPQVLPAHAVLRVVTQMLSINTPSVKKSCVQCHCSSASPWCPMILFHYCTHRHLCIAY